jgi:hypothetical protein
VEKRKWVNTLLQDGEVDEFERVQEHLGIRTNADVVRHLVRKEAQRIDRLESGAVLPEEAVLKAC